MDGPFPCELEDERWWDEGLVQDFPPCGTGSLHVLPILVTLTMEAKERRCASFVISCFQDEDFEEAKRVLPFNGGLEKGKEPRQIVQMHQSPSQVVMESASLGVIHQEKIHHKKEGASED